MRRFREMRGRNNSERRRELVFLQKSVSVDCRLVMVLQAVTQLAPARPDYAATWPRIAPQRLA